MESTGKTVVLTSNSPKFNNYGSDTVFDRLVKTHRGSVNSQSINSNYFKALDDSVFEINARLVQFARDRHLLLLDKFAFSCSLLVNSCLGVTPDGFKVYFDGEHYTAEGAAYLGGVIHAEGWLACIERAASPSSTNSTCTYPD